MESNNALITELNKKIDSYLNYEEYDKTEEACKELCRMQGLKPAEQMPEDFLNQLKQKERKNMNIKKTTKRISGVAAAAAAAVLLVGGTVSAAVIYNNNIHFSIKGLIAGDDMAIVYNSENGETTEINLPEMSEDSVISPISEEDGSADTLWLSKKVWDDTYEVFDSDDAVNWTKGHQTTRVTEYQYADYFTAVEDSGFEKLFKTNYTGDVVYYEYEDLDTENTDYSIAGEFSYGNGHFNINQQNFPTGGSDEVDAESESVFMLITTTGETVNEREYLSSAGISFKLSDDTEFGYTRTSTLFRGNTGDTVLEFIGMTEEEIHEVLDNIQP